MKQFIIIIFILLQGTLLFAQKEKKYIHKGNQLYQEKKYAEAEASYRESVDKSKASVEGNFNLGDALYKQKKFDNAAQKFTDIASSSENKAVKAKAYHNLGNSLLESKKLEESIEAYKKSLINNPKDDETRYNLAYAQEKLKQQQQQQNKDKNKDKNKKDQDKKDQNKDQNKDNKDQQNKDQQNKDKDKQDQDKKDQKDGQQPQPDKLSKEDAERMLEALKNEEKNTQDKLKNKKAKGVKGRIVKDW
ncbi:tetratricopeptide repeat protein [Pedobacter panaciterrae]|uniref:tetratricopeptide repeat protein n=1 Tax=Pedobacter panaciterrae TaxID=363849 RepID=UPI00155D88FC|nr:tetratricopeptide repeat protein [Pedobacter panaciterrae]NQX52761.1 tetratricopeptide repeat protein [Pedobacter panaciterrae]